MPEFSDQLTFISDPGHGWLRVPLANIARLEIEGEISAYSFIKGQYAFLEEDMDCPRYLETLSERGYSQPKITDVYVDRFERPSLRFQDPALTRAFWDRLRK